MTSVFFKIFCFFVMSFTVVLVRAGYLCETYPIADHLRKETPDLTIKEKKINFQSSDYVESRASFTAV